MNLTIPYSNLHFGLNSEGLQYFLAALISLSVGLILLIKSPRTKTIRAFFLITLTGFLWLLTYSFFVQAADDFTARWCLQLTYLIAIPYISPSVYLFSYYFCEQLPNRKFIGLAFGSAFLLALICSIYADRLWLVNKMPWGYFDGLNGTAGKIVFIIVLVHFSLLALMALRNLIKGYRLSKTPQERLHKKIMLFGFFIGYLSSADFGISFGIHIYPVGPFFFSLFCLIVAYAVLRHQFLDVKLVLKKLSIIISIYVLISLLIIPLSILVLRHISTLPGFNPVKSLLLMEFIVGATLSLGPFIYAQVVRNSIWLRGNLATGLTHELKSPLTAIQSAIEIMSDELGSTTIDKSRATDYVDMIKQNTSRLETYIQDLLNMAKIQEENISIEKTSFDLSTLVLEVCDAYKPLANKKTLVINTKVDSEIKMKGDAPKIRQVVSNLISNAVKFSEKGEIKVTLQKNGGEIIGQVTDTGLGIDKKNLKKIFDRFYQAHPHAKGSGIGLTIAKAWVEAHGGHIWAESEGEGKGTKISFTLPAA